MSIRKTAAVDLTVLPRGLLSDAKGHLRIDGTWDDYTVVSTLARAINWFERVTEVSVNPVTYAWKPAQAEFGNNGFAPVPVSPVNSWTAAIGATDATASYSIEGNTVNGVEINTLVGAYANGLTVTIPSGYLTAAAIDPGIVDIVLRYTAHIYEHREILVAGSEAQTPGWMLDVVATWRRMYV
jgi:hypothetical protein